MANNLSEVISCSASAKINAAYEIDDSDDIVVCMMWLYGRVGPTLVVFFFFSLLPNWKLWCE